MKTIEEKAKRYDKALERARKLKEDPTSVFYDYSPSEGDTVADYIFPELKESEDERIRKELIDFFQDWHKIKPSRLSVNVSDILAWLEKQGDQKLPIEKLPEEMKTVGESLGFTTQKECDEYNQMVSDLIMSDSKVEQKPTCLLDNSKSNVEFPFKAKVKRNGKIVTIYGGQLSMNGKEWIKYQSNKEDGYMVYELEDLELVYNIEQKPVNKIKPKFKVGDKVIGIVSDMQYYITDVCYDHYYTESGCIIMFCSQDNFKLVEQKSAWSEEDEKIRQTIINEFKQCSEWYCSNGLTKEDCINWLNKQEYFEWGDEDNENMNSLCVLLDQMVSINAIGNEHSIEYKNWLKSIKQRMGG